MKKKKLKHKAQFRRDKNGEFLDANHEAMDTYYELMNRNISQEKVKEALQQLIVIDPDFYDPYAQLAYLFQNEEEYKKAGKILFLGYQRAIARITDKDNNFPKSLPWLWLENRHIIRVIDAWANNLWEEGRLSEALVIFRKLLQSNPNDNIGARWNILAIRLGLEPDFETMFETKDMPGYMDAGKVSDWFDKESKKFPDEFDWWYKAMEKREKDIT